MFSRMRVPNPRCLGGAAAGPPDSIQRKLSDDEMANYRRPFPTPRSRRPVLQFPRELPIAGEPQDVVTALEEAHAALRASTFPKLLFTGNPGALVSPEFGKRFASSLRNCEDVELSSGLHYLQEDHPETIGLEVARWIERHQSGSSDAFDQHRSNAAAWTKIPSAPA